jgi:peptidoglycan/xylan/chitin deacetylase (PgdA/CDA1 family)
LGNALQGSQIAGLVPPFTGDGYWAASRDGVVRAAGAAGPVASVRPAAPIITVATRWASSGSSATLRTRRAPVPQPGPLQAALTFDDGPNATYTPQILSVLAAYGVPATFFTVGYEGAARPDLLRAEAAAGNAVEDHTWSHPDLTKLPASEVASQLALTADVIQQATGVRPTCFRPPYEATNSTVASIAGSLGLRQTLWNVDPADWKRPGVSAIVANVLANAHGRGVVVLMHDGGGDRSQTVAALPLIITGLRNQGYQFVQPCA